MTSRCSLALSSSLLLSFAVALGACSSSSNGAGGLGGTSGAVGGNGAHGGGTGALGGSTGSNGGSIGSSGGSHGGTTGTTGGGGAGGAAVCGTIPACLSNLIVNCVASGTCVTSSPSITTAGYSSQTCYANGVKISENIAVDSTTHGGTSTLTYTKNGSICFTEQVSSSGAGGAGGAPPAVGTIKNAAGTTVATITGTDSSTTVTCGGVTYDITDTGSCSMPGTDGTSPGDCADDTAGTCTP